jgi:hypothetical protein
MNPAEQQYMTGCYLQRHPSLHVEHSQWKAGQVAAMLQKHRIAPATMGDIGCGAGEVLVTLRTKFADCHFTGYEVSPLALELCWPKEDSHLRFAMMDDLWQSGVVFDVLLCLDVVEHVEDCFGFVRRLASKTRYAAFHFPLDLSVFGLLTRLPSRVRASAGHLHYFNRETALSLVRECGFRIVDHTYTASATEAPTSSWRTRAARWPRKLASRVPRWGPHWASTLLGGFSLLILAESETVRDRSVM